MSRGFTATIRHPRKLAALAVSSFALVAAGGTTPAQAATSSCRASVLRLEVPPDSTLLEPVVSNSPNAPCASDSDGLPSLNVAGVVSARLLQSSTTATPTAAAAHADVADVNLLLAPGVQVRVASSDATAGCSVAGTPQFSGRSEVVGLRIGGAPQVVLGTPNQTINLPLGAGQVVLNQQIVTGNEIIRRAVYVDTPALRLAVAESRAGVSGCKPPTPQCSDGIDNDLDGQVDFDPRNQPPFHPFGDQQCTSASDDDESA